MAVKRFRWRKAPWDYHVHNHEVDLTYGGEVAARVRRDGRGGGYYFYTIEAAGFGCHNSLWGRGAYAKVQEAKDACMRYVRDRLAKKGDG
jgi:hypothetical protein